MRWLVLLLPLVAACSGGKHFRISNRSCEADYLDWTGGLTYSILQGKGDGKFDYDPEGDLEKRTVGRYQLTDGDFDWETTYHPDSWQTKTSAVGYGWAKQNGDLDVLYTVTRSDIADDVWSYEIREERTGCDVKMKIDYGSDAVVWIDGVYRENVFQYTEEDELDGAPWVTEMSERRDGTWTRVLDHYDGPDWTYTYEENGDWTGYSIREWEETLGSAVLDGYTEYFLDGGRHVYYDGVDGGDEWTWEYEVDYFGDGTGSYSEPGMDCTLEYDGWECTYDCDGSTGSCS